MQKCSKIKLIEFSKEYDFGHDFRIRICNIEGTFCLFECSFNFSKFPIKITRDIATRIAIFFFDRCVFSFGITFLNLGFGCCFCRFY
jgi:hypothetical protein